MSEPFDSKKQCWICLKPYLEHTLADWKSCDKANEERGKVIQSLTKIIEDLK